MSPLLTALASWATTIMIAVAPHSPYLSSFSRTAEGLATAAVEAPVFAGEHGAEQTLALELAIALGESGFRVDAPGDCRGLPPGSPKCTPERASSFGLFQINKGNLAWLGAAREDLVGEPLVQARLALKLVRQSFKNCAGRPLVERLGWYANGGDGCAESSAGRARMKHAQTILAQHPFVFPKIECEQGYQPWRGTCVGNAEYIERNLAGEVTKP